jgi:hypothetical protein
VGKSEGRRPLGRPRRRWVDIRMDLVEVGWGELHWIGLAQDRDRWRAVGLSRSYIRITIAILNSIILFIYCFFTIY